MAMVKRSAATHLVNYRFDFQFRGYGNAQSAKLANRWPLMVGDHHEEH